MALTLEDLGYTFDDSVLETIENEVNEGIIKPTTTIVDTPVLINDFLKELVGDLKTLFETNLQNLASDFDDWFTQKATDLKAEIEETLSLDPNTLYDIYVTRAQKAEDSDKFNGKTYSEVVSDIYTNYISTATVSNALKFNGKTMDEYNDYIKNTLKPFASDTEKAFGYTYDELKSTILADITVESGGVDLDTVKTKVETEWTAYKAADSEKFAGNTADYWKSTIIPTIKVDNAVNADKINGTDYDTLIASINTMIENHISIAISSDNSTLINIIKNTKVLSANQADKALDTEKFDGQTADYWKSTIIPGIKVDNASYADNAGSLGGMTSTEWQSKLNDLESDIQNKVETTWTAYKAKTVEMINDIAVEDFDDHITDLIEEKLNNINTLNLDAKTFDGYTADEWKTDIIPNIKVNEAIQADMATTANSAGVATYAKYLPENPDDPENSTSYSFKDIVNYFYDNFNVIVRFLDLTPDNVLGYFESILLQLNKIFYFNFTEDRNIDTKLLEANINTYSMNYIQPESLFKNYTRKELKYNDDNILTNVNYYMNYYYKDEDGNTVKEEKLIKSDSYIYDEDKLTSVIEELYFNIWIPDDFIPENLTNDEAWLNIILEKTITYKYDENDNLIEENITYKFKFKTAADTDYTEEDLL